MRRKLSVLSVTCNAEELLDKSLSSVGGLADEIVVIDAFSTDKTGQIALSHNAKLYERRQISFGDQRKYGIEKCRNDWILMLDSDEVLTAAIKKEIEFVLTSDTEKDGYYIYFQNHLFGRPIYHGGENYTKLVLFRKDASKIISSLIHEHIEVQIDKTDFLKHKINHYSYRSFFQMLRKFTHYAKLEAQRKLKANEKTSFLKIIRYPIHMFWSRYITDKGYKDYYLRIVLDAGFAYMEFMTYVFMIFYQKKKHKPQDCRPCHDTCYCS